MRLVVDFLLVERHIAEMQDGREDTEDLIALRVADTDRIKRLGRWMVGIKTMLMNTAL